VRETVHHSVAQWAAASVAVLVVQLAVQWERPLFLSYLECAHSHWVSAVYTAGVQHLASVAQSAARLVVLTAVELDAPSVAEWDVVLVAE